MKVTFVGAGTTGQQRAHSGDAGPARGARRRRLRLTPRPVEALPPQLAALMQANNQLLEAHRQ